MEDPKSLLRYIDETIYYPKVLFIDRIKVDGKFVTIEKRTLEYERCKKENFGKNYQHFFTNGELNNSYCLKDFNYNLTLAGGYKYEKMAYIRILVYPCKNTTENNYHCKSREIIDYYLTSGFFSLLIKDFGLNPSNFSFPVLPTLQDIYTIIDKRILRNFYIRFGVTEIHTDISFFKENIEKVKYLQYRNNFQTFKFREEKDYLNGKEFCATHLELDDSIIIQKRTYTKLSEVLSTIGGYMQMMNTIFSLLSLLINTFHTEIKLVNSIFHFDTKKKKIGLKFRSLAQDTNYHLSSKNNLFFFSRNSLKNIELDNSKSRNRFFLSGNNISNISSVLNISYINKNTINDNLNKKKIIKKRNSSNDNENIIRSKQSNEGLPERNLNYDVNSVKSDNTTVFKDNLNLNVFDVLCFTKNSKKKRDIELFKLCTSFYKKRMDIVHVFTLLNFTEKALIQNNEK